METKDLLTRSIDEISAEELSRLQLYIAKELDDRRSRAKEIAWNKLVEAIKDYTTTFGGIEVTGEYETFSMNSLDDFSTIGEIQIRFGD